eukprot:18159-Heterococcus_DN1.PRE.4
MDELRKERKRVKERERQQRIKAQKEARRQEAAQRKAASSASSSTGGSAFEAPHTDQDTVRGSTAEQQPVAGADSVEAVVADVKLYNICSQS